MACLAVPIPAAEDLIANLLAEMVAYCEAVLNQAEIADSDNAKAAILKYHRADLPPTDVPLLGDLSDNARQAALQNLRTLAQLVRDRLAYLADIADGLANASRHDRKTYDTLATFLALAGRWASIAVQTRQLPTPDALASGAGLLISQARLPGRVAHL